MHRHRENMCLCIARYQQNRTCGKSHVLLCGKIIIINLLLTQKNKNNKTEKKIDRKLNSKDIIYIF